VDHEQFQREASNAFVRLSATLRMALHSCEQANRRSGATAAIFEKVISALTSKQSRALRNVPMRYVEGIQKGLTLVEEENRDAHVRVEFEKIQDPEVRAAFRLIQDVSIRRITPLSDEKYTLQAAAVAIVSAFEVFSLQLLSSFYKLHPKAIPGNPQVSLCDAMKLESVDKVVSRVAEKAAHGQLEKGIEDWIHALTVHCGISLPRRPDKWHPLWNFLGQTFAVRNCLVHAGGHADDRLSQRMQRYGVTLPAHGRRLNINQETVRSGVRAALFVGSQMYFGICKKQTTSELEDRVISRARSTLASVFWEFVDEDNAHEASVLATDQDFYVQSPGEVDRFQVALWIAACFDEREDDVKEAIGGFKWPESAVFKIHRATLEGDPAKTIDAIRSAVSDGELGVVELIHDPEFVLTRKIITIDQIQSLMRASTEVVESVDFVTVEPKL
jgi:hypothetical protein